MVNGGLIMVNSDFTMVISENLMISYGVAKNKHVGHKNADEADEGAKIEDLSNKQYITSVCLSKTMFFCGEAVKAKWGLIFCVFNMTVGDCLEK